MRATTTTGLAVLTILVAAQAAAAATIRVPQDHETIQEAVDNAATNDKIKISKGTYAEQVVIDGMTYLTLIGSGKRTVIGKQGIGIQILNSTNITIQSLVIEDTVEEAIGIWNSSDITLRRLTMQNTGWHGVFSGESFDILIDRCVLDNIGEDGITLSGDDGVGVADECLIKNCRITDCVDDGIVIRGAHNIVTSCRVYDCGDDGIETKSWGGDSDTLIQRCTVDLTGDEGFQVQGRGTTVQSCVAKNTTSDGFDVEADNCTITKCVSKKADNDAFAISGEGNRVEKCRGILSGDSGIRIEDAATHLEKNKLVKCAHVGVWLHPGAAGSTLIKNKASKSGEVDLYDETPAGTCTFTGNKFKTTGP